MTRYLLFLLLLAGCQQIKEVKNDLFPPKLDSSCIEVRVIKPGGIFQWWFVHFRVKGQEDWQDIPTFERGYDDWPFRMGKWHTENTKEEALRFANWIAEDPRERLKEYANEQLRLHKEAEKVAVIVAAEQAKDRETIIKCK